MAVKIRLKRLGKIRSPHFRIVVIDERKKRDGRAIEEIGLYHPKNDPSFIQVDSERAQHWLSVGAQPSEAVVAILKRTGDWQKFSGDASPSGIDPQPEKKNKTDAFNVALAESKDEPGSQAISKSKKDDAKADKKDDAKADKKDDAKADKKDDAKADKKDDAKADKKDDAKADDAKDYGSDSFRGETPPAGFEVKGNEDSMKFHAPDSPWYDRTIAEVWFKTAEAAEAAGFVNAVADKAESTDSASTDSDSTGA